MDKLKTGSGRKLRSSALVPIPGALFPPAAQFPGALILRDDGQAFISIKTSPFYGDLSAWGGISTSVQPLVSFRIDGSNAPADSNLIKVRSQPTQFNLGESIGQYRASAQIGPTQTVELSLIKTVISSPSASSSLTAYLAVLLQVGTASSPSTAEIARFTHLGNLLLGNTTGTERLSVTGNIQLTDPADSYKVGTDNVVGSRKTGWAAPTGTATRSTFATYAGQDITDPPTETEVQNIDDHVKMLSERLKALIDDLTSHGLIGPTP